MASKPIQLTEAQITRFHEDGFLIVEKLLDDELVARVVDRVEPLFAGDFETGVYPDEWHWSPSLGLPNAARQMTGAWKSDLTVASVVLSSEIGRISAMLGNWSGARLLGDSLWMKPYGATETILHQDSMYSFYHTPQEIVVGWIALSDAVTGAGTIEYVRGSHKWPLSQTISEFHAPTKGYHWDMEQAAQRAGVSKPEVMELERLCRKNELRTGNPSQSLFLIGQLRKFETRILSVLAHCLYQQLQPVLCESYSLLPCLAMNARAVLKEAKPIPGFVSRADASVLLLHLVVQKLHLS